MLFIKSEHFLLLPALLLVFSIFSFTHGASQYHQPPSTPVQALGDMRDGDEDGAVSWGVRRYLVEGANAEAVQNPSMIIAAERTHRRDILENFRYYKGGWDIRQKHYLSSAGITGAPLFLIAAIWFLGFSLCFFIIGLNYCCCYRQHCGYSPTAYAFSLIFLTLFTVAAITGCIVLYIGQGKFHDQTTSTLEHVLNKADTVVENLRNVSNYLAAAKQVGVGQIYLPADVQNNIEKVQRMISNSSITLENKTKKNSESIQHVLNSVRLALIIIATVMLLLALLGFLFSVFSLKFLVHTSVTMGWILVTVTFILCGIFLIFHNVMADTCVAMDQWLQNPTAHTALDDMLPCLDNATAQETLYESKDVTFQLVNNVNQFIINGPNSPRNELNYNQSGPMVPVVCNPFHSDMTDRKCVDGEVDLNNAAQEWKKYVCQVSETGNCTSVGRLTPAFYSQMVAIVDVSYALYRHGPFLVDIQDCTFVRETFNDIIDDHCPGLKHYSKFISIGLAMVSAAVMLSLILRVFNARERQHRVYKQFIASPPMSL